MIFRVWHEVLKRSGLDSSSAEGHKVQNSLVPARDPSDKSGSCQYSVNNYMGRGEKVWM